MRRDLLPGEVIPLDSNVILKAEKHLGSGTVVAVGPHRVLADRETLAPMDLKAGDRVLFAKFGGREVTIYGEEYLIIERECIYALLGTEVSLDAIEE